MRLFPNNQEVKIILVILSCVACIVVAYEIYDIIKIKTNTSSMYSCTKNRILNLDYGLDSIFSKLYFEECVGYADYSKQFHYAEKTIEYEFSAPEQKKYIITATIRKYSIDKGWVMHKIKVNEKKIFLYLFENQEIKYEKSFKEDIYVNCDTL